MDNNQEMLRRKSKLVAPLPLMKIRDRPPLNTLASSNGHNPKVPTGNEPVPSSSRCIPQESLILDTRYVTKRRGCGNLGILVQDHKRRISDSSDDEPNNKAMLSKIWISISTPALKPVMNKTRVLKRELQEITPVTNRKKIDDWAKRRLNFNQALREQLESPDFLQKSYMACMAQEYSSRTLSYLLQVETQSAALPRVTSETRASLIDWLMKINGVDGNPATIQTAVWYLDAVLASDNVPLEKTQVVAAASYWIAAKIHGRPPTASMLVKHSNLAFTAGELSATERVILARLKFPRQPVIPQDYFCYFAWWCNRDRPGELEVAATLICLCGMMANKFLCNLYPSVVGAASICSAVLLLKKWELIPRLLECPEYAAAKKKGENGKLSRECAILRHAVRVVAAEDYSHKFIFEQYKCIAQTVASTANELKDLDHK